MKIILTDQVFPTTEVERGILAEIGAELEVLDDPSPASIGDSAADAAGILNTYAAIDAGTMAALSRCKVIARYGIGVDNIDLEAARTKGIAVTNVPDYCVDEVADHAIALLLAVVRRVPRADSIVRSGGWGIAELRPVHRLAGRTLGLIGFGHIGREVAQRARAFKLRVIAHDPYVDRSQLEGAGVEPVQGIDELLAGADIVSVHAPLVESTRGLLNADSISKMRSGAVLINTSRGPIVNTQAVVDALNDGHLAGAGLDVFDVEPPEVESLPASPLLVVTPHSAFYSEESVRESQTKAARCVVAALKGERPPYQVN